MTERADPICESQPRRRRPVSPVLQLLSIIIGNLFVTMFVISALYFGYDPYRLPPAGFVLAQIVIVLVAIAILVIEFGKPVYDALLDPDGSPLELVPRGGVWGAHRRQIYTACIYGLFLLHLYALFDLVDKTGGGIYSPYTVMLSAPALYGPFLANRGITILGILLFNSIAIVFAVEWAGDDGLEAPKQWVFAVAAIAMIAVACGISAGRLSRANRPIAGSESA